jgi:hypothetical protein
MIEQMPSLFYDEKVKDPGVIADIFNAFLSNIY